MMMDNFPKKYDCTTEQTLYQRWSNQGVFDPDSVFAYRQKHKLPILKEHFTISLPPPNVTGRLHIGHAIMSAVEDVLVRRHRMAGYKTLWIPGTDHAAISTNAVVEKKLRKEGKDRFQLGRSAFLSEVRQRVQEHRGHITEQMKALGASMDWNREQYTMSESLSRSVRQSFKHLYDKGKVYEDYYVVNRSPGAQSVVSDIEVVYQEKEEKMYYIKYFVDGKKHSLTVATTRPETMFGDVAVAVNPTDRRYKKFIGKNVIIPLINKVIPIIGDDDVDMSFGTGVLKITPGHSQTDFDIAKKHDLPLNVYAFNQDEVFTKEAGKLFAGKPISDFLENVVQYISDIGNLDHVEDHVHTVPYCERTGCRIQPMASKQRFMNTKPAAEKLIHHLDEGDMQVHPSRFMKTFHDWLDKLRPWCISRQIRWGHRIPVWTSENGQHFVLTEDVVLDVFEDSTFDGNVVWAMMLFNLVADGRLGETFTIDELIDVLMEDSLTPQHGSVLDRYIQIYTLKSEELNKPYFIQNIKELVQLVVLRDSSGKEIAFAEKIVDMCADCFLLNVHKQDYTMNFDVLVQDATGLKQDSDTLDTWFSSSLRPFSILGRPENTHDLQEYYPNSVLETGYDIILFRVIKMMIMGVEVMGKLPFDHVYFHGLVRDDKGLKMSKSLGNVVDPLGIIDTYGSDALRLSLLSNSTPGNDINFSEAKTKYYSRFINKLWNASRFVMTKIDDNVTRDLGELEKYVNIHKEDLHDFDVWLLHVLKDLVYDVNKNFDKFNLGEASHKISQTIWQFFCDWYIEISKIHTGEHTPVVLLYVLARFLQLLHPFAPFVTENLWKQIGFTTVLAMENIPVVACDIRSKNYRLNLMMDIITQLRNLKSQVSDKGHHEVDAYIQGSSDIVAYMQDHDSLIKKLVGIKDLQYLREGQDVPDGYLSGLVINVSLGVKGVQVVDKSSLIVQLEKDLLSEEAFLQGLRNTLMKPSFKNNAPEKVIQEKEAKMEEVKKKIQGLEHELKRLKSGL